MIWRIILVLSWFNVLVNAGGCLEPMSSSSRQTAEEDKLENTIIYPAPYERSVDWINSLQRITDIEWWNSLSLNPSIGEKASIRKALKKCGCPPDDLEFLLENSRLNKWPIQLKTISVPYYNASSMSKLNCRRIPDVTAVIAAPSDNRPKIFTHVENDRILEEVKTEARIIVESFNDCTQQVSHGKNYIVDSLTVYQFCMYMYMGVGEPTKDFGIVQLYLQNHADISTEKPNFINLEVYSYIQLFKNHYKEYGLPLPQCAEQRKGAKLHANEASCSADKLKDLQINERTNDQIIKDAFNDCMQWLRKYYHSSSTSNTMSEYNFYMYMGGDEVPRNYEIVYGYLLKDHLINKSTTKECWIDSKSFGELFTHVCGEYQISIEECARRKKEETQVQIVIHNLLRSRRRLPYNDR